MSESNIREKFGLDYLIPDDKELEIKKLRAALSSRDREIRDVLAGLRGLKGNPRCWCNPLFPNIPSSHEAACLVARVLWDRVQPTKENQ